MEVNKVVKLKTLTKRRWKNGENKNFIPNIFYHVLDCAWTVDFI